MNDFLKWLEITIITTLILLAAAQANLFEIIFISILEILSIFIPKKESKNK